jgi:hypothetical protein
VIASGADKVDYGNIHESTFAMIFLAIPHRGSDMITLPMVLAKILDVTFKVTNYSNLANHASRSYQTPTEGFDGTKRTLEEFSECDG